MNPITLLLVDDHTVVRKGIRAYLEAFAETAVIGEAASGEACLAMLETVLPDVVILDLHMPGGIDGIETTRHIRKLSPHTQVVVLTAHTDEARLVGALRAGAIGYVRKDAEPELLVTAVRAAANGQSTLDPTVAGSLLQDLTMETAIVDALTERELAVLRGLAHGKTNRQIGEDLQVSDETIKTHVGNILSKLQMSQRTQAVVAALKQGLISLDEIELE